MAYVYAVHTGYVTIFSNGKKILTGLKLHAFTLATHSYAQHVLSYDTLRLQGRTSRFFVGHHHPCLYHFCQPDITDIIDKISQVFPFRTNIMDGKAILKVTKAWKRSHLVAVFGFGGLSLSLLTIPTNV